MVKKPTKTSSTPIAKGSFEIIENKKTGEFNIKPKGNPPKDQAKIQMEIYGTARVIRLILGEKSKQYGKYRKRLIQIAQAGVEYNKPVFPDLALMALEQLKEEVVLIEGRNLKTTYLKNLLKWAFGLALAGIALALVLFKLFSLDLRAFGLLWAGAMFGVWLSIAMTKLKATFNELPNYSDGKVFPFIHLIFAGGITFLFAMMLKFGAFDLKINDLDLAKFSTNLELAFFLGILGGFSEKALSLKVMVRAKEIVSGTTQ